MNKKFFIIIFLFVLALTGCSFFQPATQPSSANVNSGTVTNQADVPAADSLDPFNFTGRAEMNICNTRAICHRGVVIFENGDALTLTDSTGKELEINDSYCDKVSCYVEAIDGKEWDLVWISN